MSEAATATARPEPAGYIDAWSASLAQALGQIAGAPWPCAVLNEAPSDLAAAAERDLWMLCAYSGGLRGEMSLRFPTAAALHLAQVFVGEPAAPEAGLTAEPTSELTPEQREAVLELMRQVGGLTASTLKPRWGEVQLRLEIATGSPSWPASSTFWLRAAPEGASAAVVELHLSAALVAALRAEKNETAPSTPAPAAPAPTTPAPDSKVNLGLLMDVGLVVTLRFGSRRLPLREVLDLSPGAVVELDRQVQEPVDMLLDGRLVARGEVVVMEGQYGLRVTEVVAPGGV